MSRRPHRALKCKTCRTSKIKVFHHLFALLMIVRIRSPIATVFSLLKEQKRMWRQSTSRSRRIQKIEEMEAFIGKSCSNSLTQIRARRKRGRHRVFGRKSQQAPQPLFAKHCDFPRVYSASPTISTVPGRDPRYNDKTFGPSQ